MPHGKMKTLTGLYKKYGKDEFMELAKYYTNHIRDTVEDTISEMESRWYDSKHTITEADKMIEDHNKGVSVFANQSFGDVDMGQGMRMKM